MKDRKFFIEFLSDLRKNPKPDYGGNVLPAIELLKSLENTDEVRAYQDAIETLLRSSDQEIQSHAVSVCLGFIVFKNVI